MSPFIKLLYKTLTGIYLSLNYLILKFSYCSNKVKKIMIKYHDYHDISACVAEWIKLLNLEQVGMGSNPTSGGLISKLSNCEFLS